MRRPILLTSTLIVVFSMAIFLFRQIGLQGRNPSPLVDAFTNPDGTPCEMPCLFGIRLGKTIFNDAIRLLNQHPLTRGIGEPEQVSSSSTFFYLASPCVAIGLDTYVGEFVRHIQIERLDNDENLPCPLDLSAETLAMSISWLGEPDFVVIGEGEGEGDMTINYSAKHLKIFYTRENYYKFRTWQQDSLEFDDPINFLILREGLVPEGYTTDWLGFMRVEKYSKALK